MPDRPTSYAMKADVANASRPTSPRKSQEPRFSAFIPPRPAQDLVTYLHRLTRNRVLREAGVLVLLAFLGLAIHHSWLTRVPLSAGDWVWVSRDQAVGWFPWPPLWDHATGFGQANFANANQYPILAAAGILAQIGVAWELSEKFLFFWPLAILSFVAPWLFARCILGNARWALLSALIFGGNIYIVLIGTMHPTVAMAEAIAPLSLLAFHLAMQRLSLRWALITGLLLALEFAYDVRITYLTIVLGLLYFVIVSAFGFRPRKWLTRLGLSAVALSLLAGAEAYWLVPFLTYQGDHGLNLPSSPWIAFMRISHGITGVHPFWTGSAPTLFQSNEVNPAYFVFPLVAFLPLLRQRIRPEILWLSAAAVLSAFLIKQDNPPAGQIYDWMFSHVPGWGMFREASKLFFIVALAFSVLVAAAIRQLINSQGRMRTTAKLIAFTGLSAVVALSAVSFLPLTNGQLGLTTRPTSEPDSFKALGQVLANTSSEGPILWLGGPYVVNQDAAHGFPPKSTAHGILTLLGTADTGDPLASFCAVPNMPYCYLNERLFPYLLARTGASFVVAPASANVGQLPAGVGYQDLLQNVTSLLGRARLLSGAGGALAVWSMPRQAPVVASTAIAVVDGSQQITESVLPAFEALGLPTVYRLNTSGPSVPTRLPAAIDVLPPAAQGFAVNTSGEYALLIKEVVPRVPVKSSAGPISLPLLATTRVRGWAVYGPLRFERGNHQVVVSDGAELGPGIAWSDPAKLVLLSGAIDLKAPQTEQVTEQIVAKGMPIGPSWAELKEHYDPGWKLNSSNLHLIGDGMFNLYFTSATPSTATFAFSTRAWEGAGRIISLLFILITLLLGAATFRRRWRTEDPSPSVTDPGDLSDSHNVGRVERPIAIAGLVLLGLGASAHLAVWWGFHARVPLLTNWIGREGNYVTGASELYLACGLLLLLVAIVTRCAKAVYTDGGAWRWAKAARS
jgi:hypothetical protein